MSVNPRYANGNARRKIRARHKAIGAPCALCGQPIDYSLGFVVGNDGKRHPHPMMFVVDEKMPVSLGGSPIDFDNTQAAHWICNARKGNKVGPRHEGIPFRDVNAIPRPFDEW